MSAIFTNSSDAQSYDELEAGELMNEDNELDNETERESEATTCTESTTSQNIELVQIKSIVGSIDNDSGEKRSNKLTIDQRKSSPRDTARKQHVFSPVHTDDQVRYLFSTIVLFFLLVCFFHVSTTSFVGYDIA